MCGMDDRAMLTDWFVSRAVGFYNIDPTMSNYDIGRPLFLKVIIKLDESTPGYFVIKANNVLDTNLYIQSASR